MKVYQLIAYVNGWNKKTKKWEQIYHFNKFYVGKEGLSSAHFEYDKQLKEYEFAMTCLPSKYKEARGKVEINVPHVHKDGSLAYWGDKVIVSHNPENL